MASPEPQASSFRRKGAGYIIASVSELPPGERKVVNVGGREIGVFNVAGKFYALRNVCPHNTGPLCRGRIRPLVIDAGVGGYEHLREGEIIKCPWHLWEFDIKTGLAVHDPGVRVRSYPVELEDDEIILYLNR